MSLTADRYPEARALVVGAQKASCSFVQRRLGISYNEAARYMERMEREAVISSPDCTGLRDVLIDTLAHAEARAEYGLASEELERAERSLKAAKARMARAQAALPARAALGETS